MGVIDLDQAKMDYVADNLEGFRDWLKRCGYYFCGDCAEWYESYKDMKDDTTCKMCYALSISEPEV